MREMTARDFYHRLGNLRKAHLITRRKMKTIKGHDQYELASLGYAIHRALQLIDKGIWLGWALGNYDLVKYRKDTSVEHKTLVLNSLVTDQEIKSLLIASAASASGIATRTAIALNESIETYIR